jgi:hypothetical protein
MNLKKIPLFENHPSASISRFKWLKTSSDNTSAGMLILKCIKTGLAAHKFKFCEV